MTFLTWLGQVASAIMVYHKSFLHPEHLRTVYLNQINRSYINKPKPARAPNA